MIEYVIRPINVNLFTSSSLDRTWESFIIIFLYQNNLRCDSVISRYNITNQVMYDIDEKIMEIRKRLEISV